LPSEKFVKVEVTSPEIDIIKYTDVVHFWPTVI